MNSSKVVLLLFLFIVINSCSTTKSVTDTPEGDFFDLDNEEIEEILRNELSEEEYLLFENRSYLSDRFSTLEHDMPETYLKEVNQEERVIDESEGFRIQILSTRNVAQADSVRDNFRRWSSQLTDEESVHTYIFFRQPYYRVRVGDFRNRSKAIEFSQLVKSYYPEAWVVHDRIEPGNVLPDSTFNKIISPE
tara:strand:+ start:45751 stop:46326 length:576 start_codon:yes stop_codon:yes gene_type:complete